MTDLFTSTSNVCVIYTQCISNVFIQTRFKISYNQLNAILDAALSHGVKILMGDFNAQIGPVRTGFENVMGKEAMG